jgi:integrase
MSDLDRRRRALEAIIAARAKMEILERAEIAALLTEVESLRDRALIGLSVFCGPRQGEALALRWFDLDLDAGLAHVQNQLAEEDGYADPKTAAGVREVTLPPFIVRALREHWLATPLPFRRPGAPVFPSLNGTPLDGRNVSQRVLRPALVRAGIVGGRRTRFRWHDMRHTAASLMIAEGAPVTWVANQLGHANPAITLRLYAHLFDKARHDATMNARMEASFGTLLGSSLG